MAPDQALRFAAGGWAALGEVGLELFVQAAQKWWSSCSRDCGCFSISISRHQPDVRACRRAAALGAELITVHACTGRTLKAAQAAAEEGAQPLVSVPTLLAVTVLTSWEEQRLQRNRHAGHRAGAGVGAAVGDRRIGGCVCSPLRLRHCGPSTPNRSRWSPRACPKGAAVDQAGDGPAEAIAAGASQLVIGRPISKSDDPSAAFALCCSEL